MRIFPALLLAATLVSGASAAPSSTLTNCTQAPNVREKCTPPTPIPELKPADLKHIGMLVFDKFDLIDVFGTLNPLFYLAFSTELDLHIIGEKTGINENIQPVPPANSRFFPVIKATHTYDNAPDLDVLIVPGGPGSHNPSTATVEFVKRTFPKVKLLVTVCSGAQIAARAGVLDGRMATTNKKEWEDIVRDGPDVKWVAPARYVLDGKTWSSSGVTSGMDLMYEFARIYFGADKAERIMGAIEHIPVPQFDDVFADMFNRSTEVVPCRVEFKSAPDAPSNATKEADKGMSKAPVKPEATIKGKVIENKSAGETTAAAKASDLILKTDTESETTTPKSAATNKTPEDKQDK